MRSTEPLSPLLAQPQPSHGEFPFASLPICCLLIGSLRNCCPLIGPLLEYCSIVAQTCSQGSVPDG